MRLSEAVEWRVGDKLVVTPSSTHFMEVDEVEVEAVIDATTFQVTPALTYDHFSEIKVILLL